MARKRSKATRRQIVYRKRLLSRKIKTKKVRIITRKEQPFPQTGVIEFVHSKAGKILPVRIQEIRSFKPKAYAGDVVGGPVSSSWIALVEWHPKSKRAYMETIKGHRYYIHIPFDMFEEWYYAHSKGTYFNYMIKDKFNVERA